MGGALSKHGVVTAREAAPTLRRDAPCPPAESGRDSGKKRPKKVSEVDMLNQKLGAQVASRCLSCSRVAAKKKALPVPGYVPAAAVAGTE